MGIPFLLFLPGYALVSALWPQKSIEDDEISEESEKPERDGVSDLERIALSLGLSIALVALTGLGLNYTPWGITLNSTIIGLCCVILILIGTAWIRREKLSHEERFTIRFDYAPIKINELASTEIVMVALIIISILIGVTIFAYIAMNPPQERFTELYILDADGTTENYPDNLTVDEEGVIFIGVVCHEHLTTDYTVIVELFYEDESNETLDEYSVSLEDEEEWSQRFSFSLNATGTYKLEVQLYKGAGEEPYLTNHLWIEVYD
jgi:uncharacterized membrane protein